MPEKTWKVVERQVGEFFGVRRTPLSGGNSGHTRADTLHPRLFIEVKYRAKGWPELVRKCDAKTTTVLGDFVLVHSSLVDAAAHDVPPPPYRTTTAWTNSYIMALFDRTLPLAGGENKVPVCCFKPKRMVGFWILCRLVDISQVIEERHRVLTTGGCDGGA